MADPPETYNYDSGAGRRKTKPHVSDASDAAMRMRAVLQRAQHQVESTEAVPQGRGYPYDRPQQQPAAPVEKPSTSGSVLGEAQAQAKEVLQVRLACVWHPLLGPLLCISQMNTFGTLACRV
jgi:hypothetical protein